MFSALLTPKRCQKSLRAEKIYALCTQDYMQKLVKSVVSQFNDIFKSLTVFWPLYHVSSDGPSASQALPTPARQTRHCRAEPAKAEELMCLTRWRLAGFAPVCVSFLRANQGKPCTACAALLNHRAARNTLPCTALLRAFFRTQLLISAFLAVQLQPGREK